MMNTQPPYDISVIKKILPHRHPFLFVDRVNKISNEVSIVAEKNFAFDDWFFSGHFPGTPIVPGVIVSEALAQTSGLLLGLTKKVNDQDKTHLFLASLSVKFTSPAKPGETLRLAATLKKIFAKMFLFEVAAFVADRRIASGTLALAQNQDELAGEHIPRS